MSSDAINTVSTTSRIRRTVAGLVAAASVVAVGAGVAEAQHGSATSHSGTSSAMRPIQCWYKGWFLEDGVWYYGWFLESC